MSIYLTILEPHTTPLFPKKRGQKLRGNWLTQVRVDNGH